jgi:hypothetical protein
MKKTVFALAIFITSISSLCEASDRPLVEIQCSIRPIDRSKIHPNGANVTSQSVSENWSGYAAATSFGGPSDSANSVSSINDTVSYVAGSWVVPTLLATMDGTYSAIWVGIDGYFNGTVEQIGTSHNWVSGAQQNYAWFEMYPNGAYEITNFPVMNGDVISAKVAYKGGNTFKLVINNYTQGVSTDIPSSYTMSTSALRSSAEWIVEAPFSGGILPLSDFQTVTFNYCSATINSFSGPINDANWENDEITLEDSSGAVEAQPGALLKGGSAFQVTWKQDN